MKSKYEEVRISEAAAVALFRADAGTWEAVGVCPARDSEVYWNIDTGELLFTGANLGDPWDYRKLIK